LIAPILLDETEIRWLNNYHNTVYEALSPFLNNEEQIWLKHQCQPLNRTTGL
jgi:Xaa-Pro aminopeptidase